MPALIDADTRLDAVVVPPGQPVYLGRGRVQARLRRMGLHPRSPGAFPAQNRATALAYRAIRKVRG